MKYCIFLVPRKIDAEEKERKQHGCYNLHFPELHHLQIMLHERKDWVFLGVKTCDFMLYLSKWDKGTYLSLNSL